MRKEKSPGEIILQLTPLEGVEILGWLFSTEGIKSQKVTNQLSHEPIQVENSTPDSGCGIQGWYRRVDGHTYFEKSRVRS